MICAINFKARSRRSSAYPDVKATGLTREAECRSHLYGFDSAISSQCFGLEDGETSVGICWLRTERARREKMIYLRRISGSP